MISFLVNSIRYSIALLFGATGEILTEKSGHLNLGVPGVMCMGGLGGCVGVSLVYNMCGAVENKYAVLFVLSAIVFAFLFAMIIGAIYCFLTVTLRANQNITGLALTSFGFGICKFFMTESTLYSATSKFFQSFIPYKKLGIFGELFLSYGVLVYLGIIVAVLTTLFLKKTKKGLYLRAVGENPATADSTGINITKYKYLATMIGCGIAGIGGMYYMFDPCSGGGLQVVISTVEALGWLSVALVIFSIWNPNFAIAGAIIFGFCTNLSSIFFAIPNAIMSMAPYVVTIIVLIITSIIGKKENQPPASLGLNYFREER